MAAAAPSPQYQATNLIGFQQQCGGDPECPGRNARANDLNNSGLVVGASIYDALDGSFYAASWSGDTAQQAGFLDGFLSEAYAVNDTGLIVGHASLTSTPFVGSSDFHPFVNSNGTVIDLGQLPDDPCPGSFPNVCTYHPAAALDVNDSGVVVGYTPAAYDFAADQFTQHAFVYADGALTDLNSLIALGGGWVLERAERITNDGTIYGTGTLNGTQTPFIFKSGQVQAGAAPPDKNAWGQYVSGNTLVNADGSTHDLGIPAMKVNDRGQIVANTPGPPFGPTSGFGSAYRLDDTTAPTCAPVAAADARSVSLSAQEIRWRG